MQKIIDHLKIEGAIDSEDVAYFPKKYPFTLTELQKYMQGMFDFETAPQVEGAYFETYNVPFEWENEKFNLIVMFGQGSAWTLMTRERADEWIVDALKSAEKFRQEDEEDG